MEKPKKKLTHKDKIAIIRDVIVQAPRYWAYGWNRGIIDLVKEKTGLRLADSIVSKLKKEALKQMEDDKNMVISKENLLEMFMRIYEKTDKSGDKIKSLTEIGKLQGMYEERIRLNRGIADLTEEELLKLKAGLKE